MKFTKMHGIGNDYIYINAINEHVENPSLVSSKLSDRHFGVGSDGLVLIMSSEKADFRMRMFNPDGSESEMCGNATRCIGKYVFDKGLTKENRITLETLAGIKNLELYVEEGKVETVRVDMGEPILSPVNIPVLSEGETAVKIPVEVDGNLYEATCVSMGNPHAVLFLDEIENLNLELIGPKFENNILFPKRTNTEFVKIIDKSHAKMRVWERGTGETLACGTGACAVLVAGVMCGLLDTKATIDLPGGSLIIEWDKNTNHVFMTGGATIVFEGEIS